MSKHSITVATFGGRAKTTIQSDSSLNTWTRKDGGFTVRVDNLYTVRFPKYTAPYVLKRSK